MTEHYLPTWFLARRSAWSEMPDDAASEITAINLRLEAFASPCMAVCIDTCISQQNVTAAHVTLCPSVKMNAKQRQRSK
jgi:hypothetical protein